MLNGVARSHASLGSFGKGSFRRERNARGARGRREGESRALIPFPFPFERLPRRLGAMPERVIWEIEQAGA